MCFSCFLLVSSCNEDNQSIGNNTTGNGLTNLNDFNAFYLRFHRDTAYQSSHITFPLEGLPASVDSITLKKGDFRWNKADWVHHQLFNDVEFERSFRVINEQMVIETIQKHLD